MVERTQEELYLVNSKKSSMWSNSGTDKWCWFRVLEGPDQGISHRIPLYTDRLDKDIRSILHSLSDGDVVKAQLQRQSPEECWIPIMIEKQ